jgi:aminopeptidase N
MTYASHRTQANGLFAIDYDSPRGRARSSQFENANAPRRASWDEPAYKATFALEATVPAAQMAISNMPVASTAQGSTGGLVRVRFATSPRMSTYLLFLGVGDFERATVREGRTEVGVVARRGAIAQARFALEASQRILREYNEYFAIPYPLPKLDNVASPGGSQFFSAMENWGAIYSFERILLVDPTISTQADRQRVFAIAAHEIAHQWFGNRHHALVGRHLAQRGLCHWMASRTVSAPSRVADLGRRRAPARRCNDPGPCGDARSSSTSRRSTGSKAFDTITCRRAPP